MSRRRGKLLEALIILASITIFLLSEVIRINILYPLLGDETTADTWYNGIVTASFFMFIEGSILILHKEEDD